MPSRARRSSRRPGRWSPAPTAYAYQWQRCDAAGSNCAAILGATAPAYVVTAADAYGQLAVVVTASDADGSTSATSAPSGVVLDANGYVSRAAGPALSGGQPAADQRRARARAAR